MSSLVKDRRLPISVVPVTVENLGIFDALGRDTDTTFRAQSRGQFLTTPPPSSLEEMWPSVLCHYAVLNGSRHELVGLVTTYKADHRSGHVRLAVMALPRWQRSGLALVGAGMVLHRLLTFEPFRKVYLDIAEYNHEQMGNSLEQLFTREAIIPDQFYYDGRFWGQLIYSVTREAYATSPWHEDAAEAGWVSLPQ